jgi:uncharacterized membrane protein YccC
LTAPQLPGEQLRSSGLNEAFAAFEKRINEIRDQGVLVAVPIEMAMRFAGHFAALRSFLNNLTNIRSAMEGLPRFGQPPPEAKPHWDFLPTIDWFWVKTGVKGGLAAVIALVLLKWVNPPGPASIPLMAWTTTILGRPFLRAGGSGDLRTFQNAFLASVGLAVCAALLLLTTPFLANYAVMNLTLFFLFFSYGFLTARKPGINFWMQVALITMSAFVGLNPQQPVPSQTIIDTFLGIIIGTGIATVIGRLLWPVLPQRVLRENLLALFTQTKALLSGDPHREKIQTQLAILSVEAQQATQQIRIPQCSEREKAKIAAFLRALEALRTRITELVSLRNILPEVTGAILQPQFERLEVEFKQMLDALAECFRQGDCHRELPSVRGALTEMDLALERIRDSRILADQKLEVPLQMLDLANLYHATAAALEECGRVLQTLEIRGFWGDYAL